MIGSTSTSDRIWPRAIPASMVSRMICRRGVPTPESAVVGGDDEVPSGAETDTDWLVGLRYQRWADLFAGGHVS
jgi:hypothetical protein